MASALQFAQVRKTFGTTVALESLVLDLVPGELVSLLGPSGCGKTTALRIAAGFEVPDSGSITLGEQDITNRPAHKRNMGMVFQSYSLFPNLTVAENVAFGLRVRRLAATQRANRVGEMLERVQLSSKADQYPHQLSGGQQQRVALARALAVQPEVLLLDEPLSALDAKVRVALRDEIRRVQTELGTTTLFVTHDQEEALAISDRVGVMSSGRLEQVGTPTEIYRAPANSFVARFVGSMNELPAVRTSAGQVDVGGVVIEVGPSSGGSGGSSGASLRLLIRPEDVSLDVVDAAGTLSGSVVSQVFAGAATLVKVRLDTLDVLVTATVRGNEPRWLTGDRAGVRLDGRQAIQEQVDDDGLTDPEAVLLA
ncbi:MAG: ABC transporter ATP-binding protein [Ilumatobacteraceae bacterium]